MHIVMVSDLETHAGAATSASRLAEALCREQHRVTRIVLQSDGRPHAWTTIRRWPSFFVWVLSRILPKEKWLNSSAPLQQKRLDVILKKLQPDVINLHNLHFASWAGWSWEFARICAKHAPTVWTLHDMWSFTGRCAYSYECRKFLTGCDATCPTPTEYPVLEPGQIAGAWQQRQQLFGDCPELVAVTPSKWLHDEAQASLWAHHRVEVIPYGLPLDVYQFIDRSQARAELGLQTNGPVLMMAASQVTERRKGGSLLVEALHRVRQRPLTLLTLGQGQLEVDDVDIHVHSLGYVEDERLKVLAFNAADLYVHPAPVDNLPNTVMEALACGTPIVAFPIGGVPDMVRPGLTGWLADGVSSDAFARVLTRAIDGLATGPDLRTSCRSVAEAEYSAQLQAQRYLALYDELTHTA